VKAMFNGGTRKRLMSTSQSSSPCAPVERRPKLSHSSSRSNNGHSHHAHHQSSSSSVISLGKSSYPSSPETPLPSIPTSPSGSRANPGIWNPALGRIQTSAPYPSSNPLSFHPLTFPWFRRPIFNPFAPSIKMLSNGTTNEQDISAFKPVATARSGGNSNTHAAITGNFFNWLHNSLGGGHPMLGNSPLVINHTPGPRLASLPEDLSFNPQQCMRKNGNKFSSAVLTEEQNEDHDDDENVDIESTGEDCILSPRVDGIKRKSLFNGSEEEYDNNDSDETISCKKC